MRKPPETQPRVKTPKPILPPVYSESADVQRLAAALNRIGSEFLQAIDAAISLRTAPQEAQRDRATAARLLREAAQNGMAALGYAKTPTNRTEE